MIQIILQALLGMIADKMYDSERTSIPIFPDRIHQLNGILIFLLATVNVLLGIELYDRHPILKSLYFGYWGLILGALCFGYVGSAVYWFTRKDEDLESQRLLQ